MFVTVRYPLALFLVLFTKYIEFLVVTCPNKTVIYRENVYLIFSP